MLQAIASTAHLIPLAPHLPSPSDVCYGVHKASVYEAQLIPIEARVIGHLICPVPVPVGDQVSSAC
jgi:hypothetical protein